MQFYLTLSLALAITILPVERMLVSFLRFCTNADYIATYQISLGLEWALPCILW